MPKNDVHDRGTYFSNYSSIHSIDAYIGRQQVMYTPGSSPPVNRRKTSNRFRPKQPTVSQSIMMPSNIPNSSQIMPERGTLRDVHVHYNIPADEKQIVASLRQLQEQCDRAAVRIADLETNIAVVTKERDDARTENKRLREAEKMRETAKKRTSFAQRLEEEEHSQIEEELFDLSRVEESPRLAATRPQMKSNSRTTQKTTTENDARLLSNVPSKRVASMSPEAERRVDKDGTSIKDKRSSKRAMLQDTEEDVAVDVTGVSNISRRRRPSLDDNMTSAYIIPDITLALKQQQQQQSQEERRKSAHVAHLSEKAQNVIHEHDPEHIANCAVCQRLTGSKKTTTKTTHQTHPNPPPAKTGDYTLRVAAMMKDIHLEESTLRPKIPPTQAYAHLRKLLNDQYNIAKMKHGRAWNEYDAIDAPLHSKKHSALADEMAHYSGQMEAARVNLDQLRDVGEAIKE